MKKIPSEAYLQECFDTDNELLLWKKRPRHHFTNDMAHKLFNSECAGKPVSSAKIFLGDGMYKVQDILKHLNGVKEPVRVYRGVYYHRGKQLYSGEVEYRKRRYRLGYHGSPEAAYKKRLEIIKNLGLLEVIPL